MHRPLQGETLVYDEETGEIHKTIVISLSSIAIHPAGYESTTVEWVSDVFSCEKKEAVAMLKAAGVPGF